MTRISRRRAARARVPAMRRSRRDRCSSTRPNARRSSSRSIPVRARRSARSRSSVCPTVSRARIRLAPWRGQRRAVPARGAERPHRASTSRSAAARATTRRGSCRWCGSRPTDRVANLTLTVQPGPRVRVVFTGDPLPSDRRAELVPVEREGSVDEDLLEDSSNRIEEYLRAQGYRDARGAAYARGDGRRAGHHLHGDPRAAVPGCAYEISGNASVPLSEFEPSLRLRDGQPFSPRHGSMPTSSRSRTCTTAAASRPRASARLSKS